MGETTDFRNPKASTPWGPAPVLELWHRPGRQTALCPPRPFACCVVRCNLAQQTRCISSQQAVVRRSRNFVSRCVHSSKRGACKVQYQPPTSATPCARNRVRPTAPHLPSPAVGLNSQLLAVHLVGRLVVLLFFALKDGFVQADRSMRTSTTSLHTRQPATALEVRHRCLL